MKRFAKILAAGVCLGILLGIVQEVSGIEHGIFMRGYWIAGAAAVAGVALCYTLYIQKYRKRMAKAIIAYENGEVKAYLAEIEDMLRTARGRRLRDTLEIDLSVGHYALGEHATAIHILEGMPLERLRGSLKLVYQLNLCLYYFRASQTAQAMELYHAGEREFARYRENHYYGGNVALLDMLAAIEEGRLADAGERLAYARQRWKFPRMQKEYDYIEEKLQRGI